MKRSDTVSMRPLRRMCLLSVLAFATALAACQTQVPKPDAGSVSPAMAFHPAPAGADVYTLDPAQSQVTIYVYRAGSAARFGHNHLVTAPDLAGWVAVPDDDAKAAQFSLHARLDQLQVDDAALRKSTGGGFAAERSADDISGTRANMLKSLAAEPYPELVLNAVSVAGEWPVLVADVAISLHGVSRTQRVVLQVRHDATQLSASGSFAIRQSDFGITPFMVMGGTLGVDDTLAIVFALHATRGAVAR